MYRISVKCAIMHSKYLCKQFWVLLPPLYQNQTQLLVHQKTSETMTYLQRVFHQPIKKKLFSNFNKFLSFSSKNTNP